MARLFVRPAHRRQILARALVLRAMQEAEALGHRRMPLHTLPEWRPAQALYTSLEFERVEAYADVAVAEAICYGRDLDESI
jgi:GNAT superfamily N-acetyltransferase